MSQQLQQHLNALRRQGSLDSRGEFTLSLSDARQRLKAPLSADPARYLLRLISGGVAAGAESIEITAVGASYRVVFLGALLSEPHLLTTVKQVLRAPNVPCLEFVLGMQGALAAGADRVTLICQHPSKSGFQWTLFEGKEESGPADHHMFPKVEMEISFGGWVSAKLPTFYRTLRGYVGQRPEFRLLEQFCDRCPVPIRVNSECITRPLVLPDAPLAARVGEVGGIENCGEFESFESDGWLGALAYRGGKISVVVNGVTYANLESPDFSGVVHHQGLTLNLTRENLVADGVFDVFSQSLDNLRLQLLFRCAKRLADFEQDKPWFLEDLYYACLEGDIGTDAVSELHQWCCLPESESEPSSLAQLLGWSKTFRDGSRFELNTVLLLKVCARIFHDFKERYLELLKLSQEHLTQLYPEEIVLRGYFSLGYASALTTLGREHEASELWSATLTLVNETRPDLVKKLATLDLKQGTHRHLSRAARSVYSYAPLLGQEKSRD